jgi:hypothetical protein
MTCSAQAIKIKTERIGEISLNLYWRATKARMIAFLFSPTQPLQYQNIICSTPNVDDTLCYPV